MERRNNRGAIWLMVLSITVASTTSFTAAQEPVRGPILNLKHIEMTPEPVGQLHPKWQWLKEKKIRVIWGAESLTRTFDGTDKSVAQVLGEAGFNLVYRNYGVDRADRSTAPVLDSVLPIELQQAHDAGMALIVIWQYGSAHDYERPYRRYRDSSGKLHESTCCPVDAEYIDRHVGRWAVKSAEQGADGFGLDVEMYESDVTIYSGPCFCYDCFADYLRNYARNWQTLLAEIPADQRGRWIGDQRAAAHYGLHQAKRLEQLYDTIRARCQKINPSFLFAMGHMLESLPGLTRGFGTPSLPCLVFSESEYEDGPTAQTVANVGLIQSEGIPGLYISGMMIWFHDVESLARNALLGGLYSDGWGVWCGMALTMNVGTDKPVAYESPYGRGQKGSTAMDYLNRIAEAHKQLDQLLTQPQDAWPKIGEGRTPLPTVDIPRRTGDLTLDAVPSEPAWRNAARIELVLGYSDGQPRDGEPTVIRICYDDQAIYVTADCPLTKDEKLEVPHRGRDSAKMWSQEGIEMFFAPDRAKPRYAQVLVSPLGDIYDALGDVTGGTGKFANLAWNTDVTAAAKLSDDRYVFEARIPFADFADAPKPGDEWGANFYRFVKGIGWSPTYASFHETARFGTLRFVNHNIRAGRIR